jgi:hypothetical protein
MAGFLKPRSFVGNRRNVLGLVHVLILSWAWSLQVVLHMRIFSSWQGSTVRMTSHQQQMVDGKYAGEYMKFNQAKATVDI